MEIIREDEKRKIENKKLKKYENLNIPKRTHNK